MPMFAQRPSNDMPRLPSFDELMHSIVHPTQRASQINQQIIPQIFQVAEPRTTPQHTPWIHQAGVPPQASMLQLPQKLSTFPASNYYANSDDVLTSPTDTRPELPGSSSSFASSTSSGSGISVGLSGSPDFSRAPSREIFNETTEDSESSTTRSRRSHTCKTCGRSFTTSGHLARHNRIHTGERNHKCPYPSCNARFARQDNCTQHYRTHLNGKNKRSRVNKLK